MAMTLKERIEEKKKEIAQLEIQIKVKWLEIEIIRTECSHEHRRNYTVMGDSSQDCSDCGKSFY